MCDPLPVRPTLYEFAGGEQAFLALARAHHARCLADPELNHPFSHPDQHPQHVERLAAYWGEVLGGPPTYSRECGDESQVLHMHSGNGDMGDLGERFLACFVQALDDAGLPDDPDFRDGDARIHALGGGQRPRLRGSGHGPVRRCHAPLGLGRPAGSVDALARGRVGWLAEARPRPVRRGLQVIVTLARSGDRTEMTVHAELPAHFSEAQVEEWLSAGVREGWQDTVDRLAVALGPS